MHVRPPHALNSSSLWSLPRSPNLYVIRFTGHTSTQLAHLMHGLYAAGFISLPASTVMPDVPFITGTSRVVWLIPIIGPPFNTSLSPSDVIPPHCFSTSSKLAPMRTRRFFGSFTPLPLTVTTLSISGFVYLTAS